MSTVSKSDLPAVRATWTVRLRSKRQRKEPDQCSPPGSSLKLRWILHSRRGLSRRIFSRFSDDLPDDVTAAVPDLGRGEFRQFEPQSAEEEGECGPQRPLIAVNGLEGKARAVREEAADEPLGAALRNRARDRLHEHGVGCPGAADQEGVGPHRVGNPFALPARLK